MEEEGIRLNKYLAESGIASRRSADRLVEDGHVTLNGKAARLGDRVFSTDEVRVDGQIVRRDTDTVILVFNKPRGLVCTADSGEDDSVISFINYPRRIFTVGRLDKDSEGLILLTNDGDLANKIMRSRYGHEKEYVVVVDHEVTGDFVKAMTSGVKLDDGVVTRRCQVTVDDPRTLRIVLKQGLNRQIRRMCEQCGYKVSQLIRVRVMNIKLGDLKPGKYRDISRYEREELLSTLQASVMADKDSN